MQTKSACLVRVYNEHIERTEYPMPHELKVRLRKTVSVNDDLKAISLHHLIRSPDLRASFFIREIDELIRTSSGSVGDEELKEYSRAIKEAELEVLKNAEIVLCTCTTSSSQRLKFGTNIRQVMMLPLLLAAGAE